MLDALRPLLESKLKQAALEKQRSILKEKNEDADLHERKKTLRQRCVSLQPLHMLRNPM